MPRKPSVEKSPVSLALILMREQLGYVSQEQFAKLLHVSLPTVGRWETTSPPGRSTLYRIVCFARLKKLPIAAVLQHELEKERYTHAHARWFRLHNDEEAECVRAVLLILREPVYAELRPKLEAVLLGA
jgi:transcriptional regulator with XRE-family HTH domain